MSSSLQIRVIKQRAVKLSSSSSSSSVQKTVEKKSSIWKDYNKEF
jgi:predicted Zn-dependent protease